MSYVSELIAELDDLRAAIAEPTPLLLIHGDEVALAFGSREEALRAFDALEALIATVPGTEA